MRKDSSCLTIIVQDEMKGINTSGQALERGGVASFSEPRGALSHLAFPSLAR